MTSFKHRVNFGKASHEHHRIVFIFTHFGANLPS